jgi:large subunit ribosomal protein L29
MKTRNLRELTQDELLNRHDQLWSDLFAMRIKHAMGQLENPLQLRATRREIAQVKTLLQQQGIREVVRRHRPAAARAGTPKGGSKSKSAAPTSSERAASAGADKS